MKFLTISTAKALLTFPILFLGACGGDKDEPLEVSGAIQLSPGQIEEALAYRNPGAESYFAENSEFFRVKTAGDLPDGLVWENGDGEKEFASPKAIRGGKEKIWIQDFPRTLRVVGPDSATSFRRYLQDDHSVSLVKKHPETGGYFPGLCSEWAISEDRKTVWFRIDPKAQYSDGVPVVARHFFFTFYFMRSPWIQAPWYNNWYSEKYTHITSYGADIIEVGLKDAKRIPCGFSKRTFCRFQNIFTMNSVKTSSTDTPGDLFRPQVPTSSRQTTFAKAALSHRPGSGTGGRTIRNSGATATIPMRGNSP